jgi:hypothetical protein
MSKYEERRDPIADYVEWTNNRYNPGHFLGGNIPPYLRKSSLGPKARRLAGLALAGAAVLGLGTVAGILSKAEEFPQVQLMFAVALEALIVCAAVAMFRSGRRHRSKSITAPKDPP